MGVLPVVTRATQLTICVLGGSGFVGTEIITRLARDGHWIRVPTRSATGIIAYLDASAQAMAARTTKLYEPP